MALDGTFDSNPRLPWCRACRELIGPSEPVTRVDFQTDPDGAKGLTGLYHQQCGKRFASLARALNMMNPWGRF
jgi:hypothetical protein